MRINMNVIKDYFKDDRKLTEYYHRFGDIDVPLNTEDIIDVCKIFGADDMQAYFLIYHEDIQRYYDAKKEYSYLIENDKELYDVVMNAIFTSNYIRQEK